MKQTKTSTNKETKTNSNQAVKVVIMPQVGCTRALNDVDKTNEDKHKYKDKDKDNLKSSSQSGHRASGEYFSP